jgi:putative transposase
MMTLKNRRSIRLPHYDYSKNGCYFITVCVNDRRRLFGEIENREMALNAAGRMVDKWWKELDQKYTDIMLDEYCIMPNHFHGIIHIVGANLCVRPDCVNGQTPRSAPAVGDMVQWFKTMSTNEYIFNVKNNHWQSFNKRFWQRNYYEHIIRDEDDLYRAREYIVNNPAKWEIDEYYLMEQQC